MDAPNMLTTQHLTNAVWCQFSAAHLLLAGAALAGAVVLALVLPLRHPVVAVKLAPPLVLVVVPVVAVLLLKWIGWEMGG